MAEAVAAAQREHAERKQEVAALHAKLSAGATVDDDATGRLGSENPKALKLHSSGRNESQDEVGGVPMHVVHRDCQS